MGKNMVSNRPCGFSLVNVQDFIDVYCDRGRTEKRKRSNVYFLFKWGVDIRHNFLFEARNIWRPGPIEHLALPQGRA